MVHPMRHEQGEHIKKLRMAQKDARTVRGRRACLFGHRKRRRSRGIVIAQARNQGRHIPALLRGLYLADLDGDGEREFVFAFCNKYDLNDKKLRLMADRVPETLAWGIGSYRFREDIFVTGLIIENGCLYVNILDYPDKMFTLAIEGDALILVGYNANPPEDLPPTPVVSPTFMPSSSPEPEASTTPPPSLSPTPLPVNVVQVNDTNFPDKQFIKDVRNLDLDGDGWLSEAEIAQVTSLDLAWNSATVNRAKIKSLQGIEVFAALAKLACNGNQLAFLDVSKNAALTELFCPNNQLMSLDVSKNTALKRLSCSSNQLTSLDVSKNTALSWFYCGQNNLTSLDLSKNAALNALSCYENQLSALDVSKNIVLSSLNCDRNRLTSLDVSKNIALIELSCQTNKLTSLDVSANTILAGLWCDAALNVTGLDENRTEVKLF